MRPIRAPAMCCAASLAVLDHQGPPMPAVTRRRNPNHEPEPIYRYTRAQAIDDGVLVDLTEWASATTGFHGGLKKPEKLEIIDHPPGRPLVRRPVRLPYQALGQHPRRPGNPIGQLWPGVRLCPARWQPARQRRPADPGRRTRWRCHRPWTQLDLAKGDTAGQSTRVIAGSRWHSRCEDRRQHRTACTDCRMTSVVLTLILCAVD